MGLQTGLWVEMKVSFYVKHKLPSRIRKTHHLRRLGVKESSENTEILSFFYSLGAVIETSGRTMDRMKSPCQYSSGIAKYSETTPVAEARYGRID
jgi:hypothetical protein